MESDAVMLGRRTFEGFAAAWPSREGEFADKFNSMPKYVVSSTLKDPDWNNSTVLEGDVAEAVAKLKDEQEREVHGARSAPLGQTQIDNDLVDELRLMGFPGLPRGGQLPVGATGDQKRRRLPG